MDRHLTEGGPLDPLEFDSAPELSGYHIITIELGGMLTRWAQFPICEQCSAIVYSIARHTAWHNEA